MSDLDDVFDPAVRESEVLADVIRPLLAGHSPEVQSAALIQLVAIWAASHPDFIRKKVVAKFFDTLPRLIPIAEAEIFGDAGHPGNKWRGVRP